MHLSKTYPAPASSERASAGESFISRRILPYASALLFALIVSLTDWQSIRQSPFADIENYVSRIDDINRFGDSYFLWDNSLIGLISFEFLWFQLLRLSVNLGLSPFTFLSVVTFVSSFLTFKFLSRYFGSAYPYLILLNPISIELLSSQVRSGFAISLVLLGISLANNRRSEIIRLLILLITPFIHTSMLFVIAAYYLSRVIPLIKIPDNSKRILIFGVSLVGALIISLVLPDVLQAAGDRRATVVSEVKSHPYMAYWYIWLLFLSMPIFIIREIDWRVYFSLIVCSLSSVLNGFGYPGFRLIAMCIPIIFTTLSLFHPRAQLGLLLASVVYSALLFVFWFLF